MPIQMPLSNHAAPQKVDPANSYSVLSGIHAFYVIVGVLAYGQARRRFFACGFLSDCERVIGCRVILSIRPF